MKKDKLKRVWNYVYKFFTNKYVIFIILFLLWTKLTLIVYGLYFVIKLVLGAVLLVGNNKLTSYLTTYNVLLYGTKGKGKDLAMQIAIWNKHKRKFNRVVKKSIKEIKAISKKNKVKLSKEELIGLARVEANIHFNVEPLYLSNIPYGYGGKVMSIGDISIKPNTWVNLITDNIIPIDKNELLEGLNYYHSDTGTTLPSHEDSRLSKNFPDLPPAFALSRQLWDMSIIFNSQSIKRVWIKLREQQDGYIRALKTFPRDKSVLQKIWKYIPILKKYIFVNWRYYEMFESAEKGILPFKGKNIVGDTSKGIVLTAGTATKQSHESIHGRIKDYWSYIPIKNIEYDTRYYHKKFFGKEAGK